MPFVCGYLGTMVRDPELKQTQNGTTIANFTLASNYGYGERKGTDFISCTAFGKTAETICNYFSKGSSLIVQGEIHNKPWQKCTLKSGKEVDLPNYTLTVNSIVFLPKNKTVENNNQPAFYHEPVDTANNDDFAPIADDGDRLPF